ncbi:PH domain-containing protein [Neobacillus novalis]|uniref:PH domain-containing protein n=2 Tax=Neobacillus novalis TaxID=220687 RepID=A0AA95SDA9_9BACI|nr:PH domain-containing protein [Neobacillus novalis]WHY88812.1 PH domain-containing protein [Neobacillus novalis]
MRFYSKKGIITGLILWGAVAFLIGSFLFLPGVPEGKGEMITAILVCGLTSGFIMWCWFGTYYEIIGSQLKVVGGPFRWKIDIMAIKSIRKTRNPLSSPALSLNRLEIQYAKWTTILISPKHEEQFCAELRKINSKIDLYL